jgi:CTP synthase (UTP-ammonia lyase)
MKSVINIGVLGDFDLQKTSHPAINDSLRHAARHLSIEAAITWLPTPSLLADHQQQSLAQFDYLWASSGSPESPPGLIAGIRLARELEKPFIGT